MDLTKRTDWINSEKANNVVNAFFNFQASKFSQEEIINKSHHINFCDYRINNGIFATFIHNPMNEYFNIYINPTKLQGKLGKLRLIKIIQEAKERGIITDNRDVVNINGFWLISVEDKENDDILLYRPKIQEDGFFSIMETLTEEYQVLTDI